MFTPYQPRSEGVVAVIRLIFFVFLGILAARYPAIPQHDHLIGDQFRPVMALPLFVFPTACLQASFDVDLLVFLEVRFADFGQVPPGHYIEPLKFLAAFALGADPTAAGHDAEAGHRASTRRIAHLWITAQVADNHDFVQASTHNNTPCTGLASSSA